MASQPFESQINPPQTQPQNLQKKEGQYALFWFTADAVSKQYTMLYRQFRQYFKHEWECCE